jgi:nitroimidazol reductase NimA-like FMN-containing flavoprotein (pyridoxamine 5'-phosphate oxidase superfamily)
MENQDAVRKEVSRLLASQLLAVLATREAGQPYASLLAFAVGSDLADIFLATDRNTRKFKNIREDNRVALLVDDRTNQSVDFHAAAAVTIIGKACELQGREIDEARRIYLVRHPSLAEFVMVPSTALLKVAVSRYILVTRFQEVVVLDMDA